MDHQPFHFDAKPEELLLHLGKVRVFVLPFHALLLISITTKVHSRGLFHVILTLVHPDHHLTVDLKLGRIVQ